MRQAIIRPLHRYLDTYDGCNYIADEVGKCDHENSCGFHYRPREYFEDNKWRKEVLKQRPVRQQTMTKPLPLKPLPMELVEQFHSTESIFWKWFVTNCTEKLGLKPEVLQQVFEDYHVGADGHRNVIWWQIDEKQRVRSGHIMQYGKDGRHGGRYQNWMHCKLLKGKLPEGWVFNQCLFGAHLLSRRQEAKVCLVESEKTAIVFAAYHPDYIWLATSGCNGLTKEKLECLKGRRVIVFPDAGWYEDWSRKMKATGLDNYTVTSIDNYPKNSDIVDIYMGEVEPLPIT